MTYKQALQYLDSFIDFEKLGYVDKSSFKLERMRRLARIFGNPQDAFPSVHITGTKGKGSIAVFIAGILKEAGYCAGLYTSPHLVTPRERIRINNEMISEEDFAREAGTVQKKLMKEDPGFSPTFFEIYTLLAFSYFKNRKIDFGVIEVGLGGRLDATNIITPEVAVMSPVSHDHTYILGDTLGEIATEKSAIIKEGSVCVSAPQKEEALAVIRERCKEVGSELVLVGKEITVDEVYYDSQNEVFTIRGALDTYEKCISHVIGKYQAANAACAAGIAEVMKKRGAHISPRSIKEGIEKAAHPGRCEVVSKHPYIIFDGAQNRESASALRETLRRNFAFDRLILVFGISKDKDIKGVCEEIVPAADSVILTKAKIERGAEPDRLKECAQAETAYIADSVEKAIEKARALATEHDMILVTGSFFIIGEARKALSSERRYAQI
jgi:dihydrofolate synthase/folylpolyglutamate synthase